MAIHDIDKSHQFRLNPKPNSNDEQLQRMAHNTQGNTNRKDTDNNSQRVAFKQGMILTYDSDNKVSSVYGYVPEVSDTPVLIIAKDGYDVFVDILAIDSPTV